MNHASVHVQLLGLIRGQRRLLFGPFVLGLVGSGLLLAQAIITAKIFVALFSLNPQPITSLLLLLGVVLLARPAISMLRELVISSALTTIKSTLRDRVIVHLGARGPIPLTRERSGNLQSLVVDGVENLDPYYARYVPQLGIVAVNTVVVVTILAFVDLPTAIAVGACAAVVPLIPRLWDRVLARRGESHWDAYSGLHADFVDSLQAMTMLKAIGAVSRRQRNLAIASQDLLAATMTQLRVSLLESGISAFALVLGPLVAVVCVVLRVSSGHLPPTEVFVVSLLAIELFRPFRDLSAHWHAGYLGTFAGRRIRAALDAPALETPASPKAPQVSETGGIAVRLVDVSYQYPDTQAPALAGLCLDVAQGARVAVVGPSGSGKSTIAALLARFALPDFGEVELGGVPTSQLDPAGCARAITVVAQNPTLFHGNLRANLLEALPQADEEQLRQVITVTGLAQLGDGDPGLALVRDIGERGALLSGGQRQRVAIARALLRDAPAIVLDEATSALDVRSERALLRAVDAHCAGRTLMVIAHRLGAISSFERIVVVADGRVVEAGRHDELLAAQGRYAAMWQEQQGSGTGGNQ